MASAHLSHAAVLFIIPPWASLCCFAKMVLQKEKDSGNEFCTFVSMCSKFSRYGTRDTLRTKIWQLLR